MSSTIPHVRTRLKDLADQAGVSTATVSRVLNGKPGVAAETRKAVLAALDVLGYDRPEKLRTRSDGLVGLIVPELDNPVFPALAQAIETTLASTAATRRCCARSRPVAPPRTSTSTMLLEHGVDGIVFVSGPARRHHGEPSATTGSAAAACRSSWSTGTTPRSTRRPSRPTTASLDLAVRHLVSLGHRSIGLAIGPDRFIPARASSPASSDA